jgi:hypothetical protein
MNLFVRKKYLKSYNHICFLSFLFFAPIPGSMVTDNRIFSRNFAVYGRSRGDTARKRAVFFDQGMF